jgi:hypothetical protein
MHTETCYPGRVQLCKDLLHRTAATDASINYDNVKRWTSITNARKTPIDIFAMDRLVIPIHVNEVNYSF